MPTPDDDAPDRRLSAKTRLSGLAFSSVGTGISFVCSGFVSVLLARDLGPSEFATYGLCVVAVYIGTAVGTFGLATHMTTVLQMNDDDERAIQDVIKAACTTSAAAAITCIAVGVALGGRSIGFALILAIEIFLTAFQVIRGVADARMLQTPTAIANALGRFLFLALTAAAVVISPSGLIAWVLVARVAALIFELAMNFRLLRFNPVRLVNGPWRWPAIVTHLRASRSVAGSALVGGAVYRVDQPILNGIAGRIETGFYSAAVRAADLLGALTPIVAQVCFPGLVELHRKRDRKGFAELLEEQLALSLFLGTPLVVLVVVYGETVATTLFGAEYRGTGAALGWLAFAEWATFLSSVFGTALMATNRRRALLEANVIGLVINLPLLALLANEYGSRGAGIASAVAYSIVSVWSAARLEAQDRRVAFDLTARSAAVFAVSLAAVAVAPNVIVAAVVSVVVCVAAEWIAFGRVRARAMTVIRQRRLAAP